MSLSRSLKGASSLARHRNVLSRAERIAVLVEEEKLEEARDRRVAFIASITGDA